MIEYPYARRKQSASPTSYHTLYFIMLPADDYSFLNSSHVTICVSYILILTDGRVHGLARTLCTSKIFSTHRLRNKIGKLLMIGQRQPIKDLYTWRIRQQNTSIWWISWLEIVVDRMKFHGKIAMILREWALLLLFYSGTVNGAP